MTIRTIHTTDTAIEPDEQTAQPVFSIVAPVFNEAETLSHFYVEMVNASYVMSEVLT